MQGEIRTSAELVQKLIHLFPDFQNEWDEGEGFGYHGDYKFHTVFLTFGPISKQFLTEATPETLRAFCDLVNQLVEKGGDAENAVSTCFLEHASQLGVRRQIKPYLTPEALRELR